MPTDLVRYESDGRIARIVLDDPRRRNALSDELLDQLLAALERAAADPGIRVIALASSHERVFSSGGNLDAFADDRPTIPKYRGLSRFPALYERLGAIPKPVVCLAAGDVLAGALGIALACDLVLAKRSARFGCPEISIGAFPFMISALIFRATGKLRANHLMFSGQLLSADEAHEYGLNNAVYDDADFDDRADEYLAALAEKSPLLLGMGKQAIAATRDLPMREAMSYLQGQLALAFTSDDLIEGVTAFKEKRQPVWRGQ